jgi:hypothetical protein
VILPLWLLRLIVQGPGSSPPRLATIALDVILVLACAWALWPLKRAQGDNFLDPRRLSTLLAAQQALAIIFLIRDAWRLYHGAAI